MFLIIQLIVISISFVNMLPSGCHEFDSPSCIYCIVLFSGCHDFDSPGGDVFRCPIKWQTEFMCYVVYALK